MVKPPIVPFESPIYVARPLLPDLDDLTGRLRAVWALVLPVAL